MMNSTEMSTPVTRGELAEVLLQVKQEHARDLREATSQLATRAELAAAIAPLATKAELAAAIAPLATKAELQHAIQTAIAPLATRAELDVWGGALVARIQHGEQRMDQLYGLVQQTQQQIQQTQQQIQQTEQRLIAELARHVSAALEAMQTQIKASVEPFQDLPGRVARLETAVFGRAPRARRTRRRSD